MKIIFLFYLNFNYSCIFEYLNLNLILIKKMNIKISIIVIVAYCLTFYSVHSCEHDGEYCLTNRDCCSNLCDTTGDNRCIGD